MVLRVHNCFTLHVNSFCCSSAPCGPGSLWTLTFIFPWGDLEFWIMKIIPLYRGWENGYRWGAFPLALWICNNYSWHWSGLQLYLWGDFAQLCIGKCLTMSFPRKPKPNKQIKPWLLGLPIPSLISTYHCFNDWPKISPNFTNWQLCELALTHHWLYLF